MASSPAAAVASASGDLPKNAYSNALVSLPPRDSTQLIQTRLHKARILSEELADYFAARKEVETAYLKSLQKLARRSFLSDASALGSNFAPVYERLIAEIGEAASIHGDLEKKIGDECELVMRSAPNKGEWGRQREHDDGLSSTLKEIQTLEQQLSKDQKKLEAASTKKASQAQSKMEETQRSLNQTLELWETEAPFAFEAYQRIDVQRLELLKQTVTLFETAQSDAAQRLMSSTEKTLQAVLSFDPQSEMQEFVLKNGGAGGSTRPQRRRPPVPAPIQRANSVASSTNRTPRRGTNGAVNLPSTPSRQEFGMNSSSAASIHSTSDQNTARGAGGTLRSAFSRLGKGRSNKQTNDTSSVYGDSDTRSPAASRGAAPTLSTPSAAETRPSLSALDEDGPEAATTGGQSGTFGRSGGGLMQPMVPTRASTAVAPPATGSSAPQVDAEGYSIPPPDRKPWETGGSPAATSASLMDEPEEMMSSAPTQKMAGMNISNKPVSSYDRSQDQAALERVRSTLLGAPPARRNTTRRDRRDVRNTTFNPLNGSDAVGGSAGQFGLAPQTTGGSLSAFSNTPGVETDRAQSIVSMSSARAPAANPFEAPAGSPGLRASITETVNAIFSAGSVSRLMVTGELSVSLKDVNSTEPLHLRLESFEQLEKAAPNPAYLQPVTAQPGEYQLDIGKLSALQQGSASQATILKYQVHVPVEKIPGYVPLTVDAKWRCEPHQTSFLLNYTPNTSCKLTSGELQDVSFVVGVGPSSVSSVNTKPEGEWSPENRRMAWQIPNPVMLGTENAVAQKLLARFQVDGEGQPSPVQIRWRIAGQTLSNLGLALTDNTGLTFDEVARQTISGKYIAQ